MWSWHFPPDHDVTAVPQLLHATSIVPVHHELNVRICVVSILRFFVIDPFMIVFSTIFISDLSDDLSFV